MKCNLCNMNVYASTTIATISIIKFFVNNGFIKFIREQNNALESKMRTYFLNIQSTFILLLYSSCCRNRISGFGDTRFNWPSLTQTNKY